MRELGLQGWERSLIGVSAIDSLDVNLGDMVLIDGVVGSGRTKSQGSKGESHGGAHVDHFGLMLVEVGLVDVCFHSIIRGERGI
jgi:hypothetical protein